MRARPERQRSIGSPIRCDVELARALVVAAFAVGRPRAHQHDRSDREQDVAVRQLVADDPNGEGGHRLEPEHFVGSGARQPRITRQRLPLVRMLGKQPQPVRELVLRRVDPATQHRHHRADDVVAVETVAVDLGVDQLADQIVLRRATMILDEPLDVRLEGRRPLLDLGAARLQRLDVKALLDDRRVAAQERRVGHRRTHIQGDHPRRKRAGERIHRLERVGPVQRGPQLGQLLAHRRTPAIGRPWSERSGHEPPQPLVIVAVATEQATLHHAVDRPLADAHQLHHHRTGELECRGLQEELGGLAFEHRDACIVPCDPRRRASVGECGVEPIADHAGLCQLEHRKVEVGEQHRLSAPQRHADR